MSIGDESAQEKVQLLKEAVDICRQIQLSLLDEESPVGYERRSYKLKMISEYFAYILAKDHYGSKLYSQYWRYITEPVKQVVDDDSGDTRRASKDQKQQLGTTCAICSRDKTVHHHIVPYSAGGPTALWNLAPLCKECHKLLPKIETVLSSNPLVNRYKE